MTQDSSRELASVTIAPIDNVEGLGPDMRTINPKQRAFVRAYIITGGTSATRAAAMSDYGDTIGSQKSQAYRLIHDERILAAIREEAQKSITSHVFMAANVLAEIAADPTHKDRLKAADMLLNRGGLLIATQHNVNINIAPESNKEVIDRIQVLAERLGVDPKILLGRHAKALPPPREAAIDAEFTPISSAAGLEDLL